MKLSWKKVAAVALKHYVIDKAQRIQGQSLQWKKCKEVAATEAENYNSVVMQLIEGKEYVFRVHGVGQDDQHGLYLQSEVIIVKEPVCKL